MRSDPVPVTNRNHRLLFCWLSVNGKFIGDISFLCRFVFTIQNTIGGDICENISTDTELKHLYGSDDKDEAVSMTTVSSCLILALNVKVFIRQDHLTLNIVTLRH